MLFIYISDYLWVDICIYLSTYSYIYVCMHVRNVKDCMFIPASNISINPNTHCRLQYYLQINVYTGRPIFLVPIGMFAYCIPTACSIFIVPWRLLNYGKKSVQTRCLKISVNLGVISEVVLTANTLFCLILYREKFIKSPCFYRNFDFAFFSDLRQMRDQR